MANQGYEPVFYETRLGVANPPPVPTDGCSDFVEHIRQAQAQYDQNDEGHIVPVANKRRIFYINKNWPDIGPKIESDDDASDIWDAIDRVHGSPAARRVMVAEALHEHRHKKEAQYKEYYTRASMVYWSHSFVTYIEYTAFAGLLRPAEGEFVIRLRDAANTLVGGVGGKNPKKSIDHYSSSPNMLMKCLFVYGVYMMHEDKDEPNAATHVRQQLEDTIVKMFTLYLDMYRAIILVDPTFSPTFLNNLPKRLNPFIKQNIGAVKRALTPPIWHEIYETQILQMSEGIHSKCMKKVEDDLRAQLDNQHRQRTLSRMAHHRIIHLHDLKKATFELHSMIYGSDANDPLQWDQVVVNQSNIAAALVLLVLCYGPRSLGCTLMNYITPRIGLPLEAYNNIADNANVNLDMYGSQDYVIFVHHLTKQLSIEKQALHNISRVQQADLTDETLAQTIAQIEATPDEGNSRPILWFFMLPITTSEFSIETAVKNFLILFKRTRDYIHDLYPDLPWHTHDVNTYIDNHNYLRSYDLNHYYVKVTSQTTDEQRQQVAAAHQVLYNMSKRLQVELFGPRISTYQSGQTSVGMHDLRRIYASAAYNAYGNVYTLQTEFTRAILHHKDHSSSLLYQMLQVVDSDTKYNTTKSINTTTQANIEMILTRLEKLLDDPSQLTAFLAPPRREIVKVVDNDDFPYHIPALLRAHRGLSFQQKVNRTIEHLENHVGVQNLRNIKWNAQLLRRLNVNTIIIDSVLHAIQNDEDRREHNFKSQKLDNSNLTVYTEGDADF